MNINRPVVSVEWLKDHLNDKNLVLLDSTWFLPKSQRSGKEEHKQDHILGAVFFDYDLDVHKIDENDPKWAKSAIFRPKDTHRLV